MSIVKAPLMSLDAHGTIGDTITYRESYDRTVASEYTSPKTSYAQGQINSREKARRNLVMWHMPWWAELDTPSWNSLAKHLRLIMTGYHLYMREANKIPLTGQWPIGTGIEEWGYDPGYWVWLWAREINSSLPEFFDWQWSSWYSLDGKSFKYLETQTTVNDNGVWCYFPMITQSPAWILWTGAHDNYITGIHPVTIDP